MYLDGDWLWMLHVLSAIKLYLIIVQLINNNERTIAIAADVLYCRCPKRDGNVV